MKKALVALMIIATALVAQANVWNLSWQIAAALAPEDTAGDMSISLFENYGITWELINATAGDSVIASTSLVNGSMTWDDKANGGNSASYDDFLFPSGEGTRYMGSTDLSSAQSVYQKITLISNSTGEEFVWASDPVSVTPVVSTMDTAVDLGKNVVIAAEGVSFDGATMATWTKTTTIPEPATMSLLGLGALAMVLRRRIRR